MGCGPSRVSITGLKLQRRKQSNNNNNNHNNNSSSNKNHQQQPSRLKPNSSIKRRSSSSSESDQATVSKALPNDLYIHRSSHLSEDIGIAKKRIANKIRPISGPLQPPLHRSSSQIDFFKMLDEKIESGKDYSSDDDACSRRSGFSHRTRSSTSPCDMRPIRQRLSKGDS